MFLPSDGKESDKVDVSVVSSTGSFAQSIISVSFDGEISSNTMRYSEADQVYSFGKVNNTKGYIGFNLSGGMSSFVINDERIYVNSTYNSEEIILEIDFKTGQCIPYVNDIEDTENITTIQSLVDAKNIFVYIKG